MKEEKKTENSYLFELELEGTQAEADTSIEVGTVVPSLVGLR